jgi:hypothetical protein
LAFGIWSFSGTWCFVFLPTHYHPQFSSRALAPIPLAFLPSTSP